MGQLEQKLFKIGKFLLKKNLNFDLLKTKFQLWSISHKFEMFDNFLNEFGF